MCLVIYAWLVAQDYFKELTDQDVRKRIYEDQRDCLLYTSDAADE